MTLDPQTLLTELKTDPKQLHYAGKTDAAIAELLNQIGLSGETCPNTAATIGELLIALDTGEWSALSQPVRDYLTVVAQQPSIDLSNANVVARIAALFPANGPTRTALAGLMTRPCSRTEAVFGPNRIALPLDVTLAKALNGGVL
jgi:hypothetical protein